MKQSLRFKIKFVEGGVDVTTFLEYAPVTSQYHHGVFGNLDDLRYSIQAREAKLLDAGISLEPTSLEPISL